MNCVRPDVILETWLATDLQDFSGLGIFQGAEEEAINS